MFMGMFDARRTNKKRMWLFLIIYPFVNALFLFLIPKSALFTVVFSLIIPIFFMYCYKPYVFKKVFIFSLIFIVPVSLIFEYIASATETWRYIEPHLTMLLPNHRLFGQVHLEVFLWYFCLTLFYILVYEALLDRHFIIKQKFPQRIRYLKLSLAVIFSIFVATFIISPQVLQIPYIYLIVGIVLCLTPLISISATHPRLIPKLAILTIYFTYYNLITEWIGLGAGYWDFPNPNVVIGYVSILQFKFPIEELVFWIILAAPTAACLYELFADDLK